MNMRLPFTRRRMIAATTAAGFSLDGQAARSEAAEMAGAAREPASSPLRILFDRLASSGGAALIGFALSTGRAAAGSLQRKMQECPSITDFGARADDKVDSGPAIQQAIDALSSGGGGALLIPAGIFRFVKTLRLPANVRLQGVGPASVLHFAGRSRDTALRATGTAAAPLLGISLRDLTVRGDANFSGGKPDVINGNGVFLEYVDGCEVTSIAVEGFSDGGIVILNGNTNSVSNCRVTRTAQAICFIANDVSVTGNIAIGNRITATGEYNGLHLEGGFGGSSRGEVRHTTLSGNTIDDSWEAGINIELAPYTSCVGNTVRRSGVGRTPINMGIKIYGGFRSSICGNTVMSSTGDAIVVGANSGECAIAGNTTAGNGGSLLLTDSGAQVSNDVAIGVNSFTEGEIRTSGNVGIRSRLPSLSLANRNVPDPRTLDWYEEGEFAAAAQSALVSGPKRFSVRDARFTRIGNVVHVSIMLTWRGHDGAADFQMGGLPFAAAATTHLTVVSEADGNAAEIRSASIIGRQRAITLRRGNVERAVRSPSVQQGTVTVSGHYMVTD